MLTVLPTTSSIHRPSYSAPQQYEHYPTYDYYPRYDPPRFTAPSYPSHLDFFFRPSTEELEEREYQRALEVVVNHRRRQAERAAAIRRQQLAEAARQRYFTALATELEQRRQEELLAARRAELIRSERARERLGTTGREQPLHTFFKRLQDSQRTTCRPHVAKRKSLADVLKQRLAAESDTDIADPIKNLLSALLEPRSVDPQKPKASGEEASNPGEDAAKLIGSVLSSIFPGLLHSTEPEPTPGTEQAQASVPDKGKGKARAVDVEEPQKPAPESKPAEGAFADMIRHVIELSKSIPTPRSSNEPGPSGTSPSSSSPAKPAVTQSEQAQIDRAIALSSVEHIQNAFTKLQSDFVLPTELDHYNPYTDDRDETASISSVSSDLTKLIPYTRTNKPVYKYESELSNLLEELDRIDSQGDAEVREKRKAVVKAVEKALESVEHVVGEVVEKRLSALSATASTTEAEPLKGFDVGDDVTNEVVPVQEQVAAPAVVDEIEASDNSTPVPVEEPVIVPAEVPIPIDDAIPETDAPTVPETANPPVEQPSTASDIDASTATITPDSVKPTSGAETGLTGSQVEVDTPEIANPLPVEKSSQTDGDSDSDVLSLDSEVEKSDWSEVEH